MNKKIIEQSGKYMSTMYINGTKTITIIIMQIHSLYNNKLLKLHILPK